MRPPKSPVLKFKGNIPSEAHDDSEDIDGMPLVCDQEGLDGDPLSEGDDVDVDVDVVIKSTLSNA